MKITDTVRGVVRTVRLEGRLDATTSPEAEKQLLALAEGGSTRMALDCSDLEYVSSAGLRVFLSLAKRTKAAGGKLALGAPRPQVREIFEIAGFSSVLQILGTLDEAVAACQA